MLIKEEQKKGDDGFFEIRGCSLTNPWDSYDGAIYIPIAIIINTCVAKSIKNVGSKFLEKNKPMVDQY